MNVLVVSLHFDRFKVLMKNWPFGNFCRIASIEVLVSSWLNSLRLKSIFFNFELFVDNACKKRLHTIKFVDSCDSYSQGIDYIFSQSFLTSS